MQRKGIWLIVAGVLLAGSVAHAQQVLKTLTLSAPFGPLSGTPRVIRNQDRDNWLVVWRQGARTYGRLVASSGSPGTTRMLAGGIAASERSFDTGYDSFRKRYVLVCEKAGTLQLQIYSPSLAKQGPAFLLNGSAGGTNPRIAVDSGQAALLVFWLGAADGGKNNALLSEIVQFGQPSSSARLLARAASGTAFSSLNVSTNPKNGNVIALLTQEENGRAALVGYLIKPDGSLVRSAPLLLQPNSAGLQSSANAAFDGTGTGFAVWSYSSALKYRKISASGNLSSPARSLLNAADSDSLQPAIAPDEINAQFIAVWPAGGRIHTAGWNSTGTIRTQNFELAESLTGHSRNVAVSYDPQQGNTLAVWEDLAGGAPRLQIRACLFYPAGAGNETAVTLGDNFFSPKNVTVSIGTVVTWTNQGNNPHTVTSGTPVSQVGMVFDSGGLNPGKKFSFRFTKPGAFPYFCRVHGVTQSGTVQVTERPH